MITVANPIVIHWTHDMRAAITFYRDVFGLPLTLESEHLSVLELPPIQLLLHVVDNDEPAGPLPNAGLNLEVHDLDTALELISRHGGRVVDILEAAPPVHIRVAICSDPDGNVFELRQRTADEG